MFFFKTFFNALAVFISVLIFLSIFIFVFFYSNSASETLVSDNGDLESQNKIVVLNLNGVIIHQPSNINDINFINIISPKLIKNYLDDVEEKKAKVLIINLNSPGGTVSATNEIFDIIYKFRKNQEIEIIFYTQEILTSGGYWIALSGNSIFANYGAIIGSIGVSGPSWFFYENPTLISNGLLGQSIETKTGIKVFSQNAGKSKDLFNPFRKPSKGELKHLNSMVDDIYIDFVSKVSKWRSIEIEFVKNNLGALIFTSKSAKENFLIDGITNIDNLIKSVAKEKDFDNYQVLKNRENITLLERIFYSTKGNNYNVCKYLKNSIVSISTNYISNCSY